MKRNIFVYFYLLATVFFGGQTLKGMLGNFPTKLYELLSADELKGKPIEQQRDLRVKLGIPWAGEDNLIEELKNWQDFLEKYKDHLITNPKIKFTFKGHPFEKDSDLENELRLIIDALLEPNNQDQYKRHAIEILAIRFITFIEIATEKDLLSIMNIVKKSVKTDERVTAIFYMHPNLYNAFSAMLEGLKTYPLRQKLKTLKESLSALKTKLTKLSDALKSLKAKLSKS